MHRDGVAPLDFDPPPATIELQPRARRQVPAANSLQTKLPARTS
ncbi:hypothetical protein APY04_1041 [Hyphomicrobium sulfonivorans]|uniref:Uncharacterized protein n=1 Tax=Hyphomicrobium sulfonivorans TaxID=121290 RepID=A0A120CX43_HYPSL|nr:hypothetical protein APY04_1041 [Hyphomicrobium sulfonivorans]